MRTVARTLTLFLPLTIATVTILLALPTVAACPSPDFFLTAASNMISATRPTSGTITLTSTIAVTSNCGFAGTVNFLSSVSTNGNPPNPPTAFVAPPAVTVFSNGVASTTLYITVASNTTPKPSPSNPYTITVTGQATGITHTITVNLTVAP